MLFAGAAIRWRDLIEPQYRCPKCNVMLEVTLACSQSEAHLNVTAILLLEHSLAVTV